MSWMFWSSPEMSTGGSTSDCIFLTAVLLPRIETLSGITFIDSTCSPSWGCPTTETLTGILSPTISFSKATTALVSVGETESLRLCCTGTAGDVSAAVLKTTWALILPSASSLSSGTTASKPCTASTSFSGPLITALSGSSFTELTTIPSGAVPSVLGVMVRVRSTCR